MIRIALILLVMFSLPHSVMAQGKAEDNVRTCLSGKYPALCDYSALTGEQLKLAREAELRENFNTCSSGKYRALCDHSKLDPEQTKLVLRVEKAENLRVCSSGKYPALCQHHLLSQEELRSVREAERLENLQTCLDGRYPALCKRTLIRPEDLERVAAAEKSAKPSQSTAGVSPLRGSRKSGDCEKGHWIQEVHDGGEILELEDGTFWRVDAIDVIDSSLWLPISEVLVCEGRIVNLDDGEVVSASQIGESGGGASAGSSNYEIEAASDDELFIINGEVFSAKTYCFGWEDGDRVKFVSGSPFGACVSATVLNLRVGETCEMWCE